MNRNENCKIGNVNAKLIEIRKTDKALDYKYGLNKCRKKEKKKRTRK